MKYEGIYSFNAIDAVKEGKEVYMLDRKEKEVFYVNGMEVSILCEILETADKSRYEFWVEKGEEQND